LSGQANPKVADLPRDSYPLIQPKILAKVSPISYCNRRPRVILIQRLHAGSYENSALTSNPLPRGEEGASAAGEGKLRHCKEHRSEDPCGAQAFKPMRRSDLSLNLGGVEETFQLPDAGRMTHFTQCFGFDLPYALAGDAKLPTDLFEGATISIN
jgi:hypothetical protein